MDDKTRNAIRAQIVSLGLCCLRYKSEANLLCDEVEKEFIAINENTNAKTLADIKGKIKKAETLTAVSDEIMKYYETLWTLTADWESNGDS